ncbi:MAG: flagellar basal body L-ring protein FlgH [Verrucomicrobia bacterium]|nr:flagellar basal body L-ring protein FlgH [Verrucomicrobiota bacterium]
MYYSFEKTLNGALYCTLLLLVPASSVAESIWTDNGMGAKMFTDRRAMAVGDIVTVIILERASVSASKKSTTDKSTSVQDQFNKILFSSMPIFEKDGELPGLDWGSSSTFSGGGTISDQQSAQTRLSAVVIDRQPNGNLVIEGIRKTVLGDEKNYVILRGLIRPTDIQADNTILSSRIADAELEMIAEGSLTEAQRRGWLSRLHSWINPF